MHHSILGAQVTNSAVSVYRRRQCNRSLHLSPANTFASKRQHRSQGETTCRTSPRLHFCRTLRQRSSGSRRIDRGTHRSRCLRSAGISRNASASLTKNAARLSIRVQTHLILVPAGDAESVAFLPFEGLVTNPGVTLIFANHDRRNCQWGSSMHRLSVPTIFGLPLRQRHGRPWKSFPGVTDSIGQH